MPNVQKQSRNEKIQDSDAEELQAAPLCEAGVHAMRCPGNGEKGDNYGTSCSSTIIYGRWMCLRTCFPEPNRKQTLVMEWLRLRLLPSPKGTQMGSCSGMRGNKGSWRRRHSDARDAWTVCHVFCNMFHAACFVSPFELHVSMYLSCLIVYKR